MRSSKEFTWALLLLAAGLAGFAAIWWSSQDPGEPPSATISNDAQDAASLSPLTTALERESPEGTRSTLNSQEGETRADVERPLLFGSIHTVDGHPVADAEVTWTALSARDSGPADLWSDDDHERLQRNTLHERTLLDGTFAFSKAPGHDSWSTSVVWVSSPGFEALARILENRPQNPVDLGRIELTTSPAIEVAVLDPFGQSAPGVRVDQIGAETGPLSGAEGPNLARAARRAFHRRATTGDSGRVRLGRLAGRQRFQAGTDAVQSAPWEGEPIREVILRLAPIFSAGGAVVPWEISSVEPPTTVTCSMLMEEGPRKLICSRVGDDGRWSIPGLPFWDGRKYSFRLDGAGWVPREEVARPPAAGAEVRIDFEAVRGFPLRIHVLDRETKQGIEGATAIGRWEAAWRTHEASARANADGLAVITGCGDDLVDTFARATGYAEGRGDGVWPAEPDQNELTIELARAGRIRGKCTYRGVPLENFEVLYWTANPSLFQSIQIQNSQEGSFEIEDAPLGKVTLTARSGILAQSEPRTVDVSSDTVADVLLDLPDGIAARGRVADSMDGRPIPGATVQVWTSYLRMHLSAKGLGAETEADGSFELRGFSPGFNDFGVEAPGYGRQIYTRFAQDGELLNLGTISLSVPQQLLIQYVADGPFDFSGILVIAQGPTPQPERGLDAQGRTSFDAMTPGLWWIVSVLPDGTGIRTFAPLKPGRRWSLTIPVGGATSLDIAIDSAEAPLLPVAKFSVVTVGAHGRFLERLANAPAEGRFHFDGLPAGNAVVSAMTADLTHLACERIVLQPGVANSVVLHPSGRIDRFRVVDGDGMPVEGARVDATSPGDGIGWYAARSTDQNGLAEFRGFAMSKALVFAQHASLGSSAGIEVELSGRPDDVHIVPLAAGVRHRVRTVDGTVPCAGIEIRISNPQGLLTLGRAASGQDGWLETNPLEPGKYRLEAAQPGYWPVEQQVEIHEDSQPTLLQTRRLGGIELQVVNVVGLPVTGIALDLESVEFGQPVSAWIAQGLLLGPTGGLQTDDQGRMRVVGLPNGDYRWKVPLPDGALVGTCTVPPQDLGNAKVALP